MYPTAAHDWYEKNNALVINEPMQICRDKIEPLLEDLLDFFKNKGNTTDGALGAIIQGLTDSRMKQVNDAFDISEPSAWVSQLATIALVLITSKKSGQLSQLTLTSPLLF